MMYAVTRFNCEDQLRVEVREMECDTMEDHRQNVPSKDRIVIHKIFRGTSTNMEIDRANHLPDV